MTPEDYPKFVQSLAVAAEGLGQDFSAERIDAYWVALSDLPLDVVQRGLKRTLTAWQPTFHEAFPWPRTVRELAYGGHMMGSPPPPRRHAITAPEARKLLADGREGEASGEVIGPGRQHFREVMQRFEEKHGARLDVMARDPGEEG